MIVLLVDKLDNRPRRAKGFDIVLSCGQYPRAFDGIPLTEVHVTEEATQHPKFERLAATLAHTMWRYPR